ncbi:MAG: hypothetical protein K6F91_06660 [Ruminococcus sp.]|nr:hypothetical protein [Ruminococcus sp.]
MKRLTTLILSAIVLFSLTAFPASAQILEACCHCNATGKYSCPACGNKGTVTCDQCGGKGVLVCDGEPGKGKCDGGYYTCPSCRGDGKEHDDRDEIVSDTCPNCGGTGKISCAKCHDTPGYCKCTRCGGSGSAECQIGDCKLARQAGYKCPYCLGTGWLGGVNDGVSNVPHDGDTVRDLNGKESRWGTEKETQPPETTTVKETQPPEETQSSKKSKPKQTEAPKQDDADDEVLTQPVDGGPLVEYKGEGFKIEFDTGETKAPFLNSDKKEVINIVSSVKPGHMSKKEKNLFTEMAKANGASDLAQARIYPLYFEGHIKLDRNIRVSIDIPEGDLEGGYDLNIYHIKEDGTIEYLKDAELTVTNYPGAYIRCLTFKTKEFSTFFTARKDFDLSEFLDAKSAEEFKAEMTATTVVTTIRYGTDASSAASSDVTTTESKQGDGDFTPMAIVFALIAGAATMLLAVIVVVVKIRKKKK